MLSKKAISEFKEIWKAEYGQDLSDKEVLDKATRFLTLFKTVYRPIPISTDGKSIKNQS